MTSQCLLASFGWRCLIAKYEFWMHDAKYRNFSVITCDFITCYYCLILYRICFVKEQKQNSLPSILKRIGTKLAELRKSKGYTSHETFAYDNNIPRGHYWKIEKGKTNITLKSLLAILDIHKVSYDEFIASLPKEIETKDQKTKKVEVRK